MSAQQLQLEEQRQQQQSLKKQSSDMTATRHGDSDWIHERVQPPAIDIGHLGISISNCADGVWRVKLARPETYLGFGPRKLFQVESDPDLGLLSLRKN